MRELQPDAGKTDVRRYESRIQDSPGRIHNRQVTSRTPRNRRKNMRCLPILAATLGLTIVLLGRSLAAEEPTARQTLQQWCEALEAEDLERATEVGS